MKLSKRQLKRIIREEKANIFAEELRMLGRQRRTNRIDEFSFKGAMDTIGGFFTGLSDYMKGIETWLEENEDYIVPVYNLAARAVNARYGKDLPLLGWEDDMEDMETTGIDYHTKQKIEDMDSTSDPGVVMVATEHGKFVTYDFRDPATGDIDYIKDPKITVESIRRRRR